MNVYFYPPRVPVDRDVNRNPYTTNFMDSLGERVKVVNKDSYAKIAIADLLKYLFKIDTIVFNWIENLEHRKLGKLQFVVFMLAFQILKLRKVKIIWVFHNIHPHQGESFISKHLYSLFFKRSDLIVTHSRKAENHVKSRTQTNVLFQHHPNNCNLADTSASDYSISEDVKKYDVLIWGAIAPYKGILEFLTYLKSTANAHRLKIKIIGNCTDKNYARQLALFQDDAVDFENRSASFSEIRELIQCSKNVVFPYQTASVSSSGALFDTLCFGGNCIGPNTGAFNDLAEEKLCHVFDSYEQLLPMIEKNDPIEKEKIQQFVQENTWDKFCQKLIQHIEIA